MPVDSAIISLLKLNPSNVSSSRASSAGGSATSTSSITATLADGTEKKYFLKMGKGVEAEVMSMGEHESLTAIHNIVPTLCPQSYGHGELADTPGQFFLITDFIDFSPRSSSSPQARSQTLAHKLAKLHTTPAPTPAGYLKPQFGFSVPTCCGNTPQPNTFTSSWADFYANHRLRFIDAQSKKSNGTDKQLEEIIAQTCTILVPRLLGDKHLKHGKGVTPVVVHGDLWSGNASLGTLPRMAGPEEIVYDSSAVYAHSEYELGIMQMFGGFGREFLAEYHGLVPKTSPEEEYEDRVKLYEVFHHLNHYAMFGSAGYKRGAIRIMEDLLGRYGGSVGET
ncbi:hypothetical protein LTR62_002196 [Meristemomyces frigidus]|uniref:protein-ribulosamine 3-kinase n=1 Tax=Meristemomyces frigidus TaxID=1508187 RepID=A0AAN7TL05_9PEZI|nr:hypothetical protein LTR62_002196 [Meristemomyces frigidus]